MKTLLVLCALVAAVSCDTIEIVRNGTCIGIQHCTNQEHSLEITYRMHQEEPQWNSDWPRHNDHQPDWQNKRDRDRPKHHPNGPKRKDRDPSYACDNGLEMTYLICCDQGFHRKTKIIGFSRNMNPLDIPKIVDDNYAQLIKGKTNCSLKGIMQ